MGRKPNNPITPRFLLRLAGALFALWVVVRILSVKGGSLLAIAIVIAGIVIGRQVLRQNKRRAMLGTANSIIEQHLDQLTRRRAQLVRDDPYGKTQTERWAKEIDYFIAEHISPRLSDNQQILLDHDRASIAQIVADRTEARSRETPVFSAFSDSLSPTEFELFCAEQLRTCGWDARVTLRSRDQGVDVIGEKAGIRIVLQCKLYSGPVGNQAVQEIVAGRAHEQAHWGAVVTNSRYTSAAEQLASTNGILLLHYSDLANLDTLLQTKSRANESSNQIWPCPVCHVPGIRTRDEFCRNCGTKIIWPK
jgi:restriction system protein